MAGHCEQRWDAHYEPVVGPHAANELSRCLPWLQAALQRSGFGTTIHEMADRVLFNDRFDLWPGDAAVIVTERSGENLNFWLAGGDLEELEQMVPCVDAWAQDKGFKRVLLYGRRGWERTFLREQGYSPRWTVMAKEL